MLGREVDQPRERSLVAGQHPAAHEPPVDPFRVGPELPVVSGRQGQLGTAHRDDRLGIRQDGRILGRLQSLRRFVRLAGGRASRIVVIPTASSFSTEASALYRSVFARLKAGQDFEIVHPPTRAAASSAELVARLDAATGIFMTGGSQLKLSQNIVGTPVGDAIHRAYQRGAVIAGTSAGASIMSQFMISLGDEGVTPRQRSSQLSAGLGLVTGVVVDQHFDQRGRYGRLLSIVANSPNLIGIGIDENTAAEIRDERLMSVVGAGAVFVLDARHAITDAPEARRGAPLPTNNETGLASTPRSE